MLVLSRRENEKILFPNLGVSIEVLQIKGSQARIGIEAPPEVTILRAELTEDGRGIQAAWQQPSKDAEEKQKRHRLRGKLNVANMAVFLAQKQLQLGLTQEAEKTLAEAMDQFQSLEAEVTANKQPLSSGKRMVLVVEDDAYQRALLTSILELSGVQVETAEDGSDALNYLSTHGRPDLVLLDMMMPRCDGPSTLAAIRQDPKYAGLKIFGVSGYSPQEFNVPIGPDGIDGWFSKPINSNRLTSIMNEVFPMS